MVERSKRRRESGLKYRNIARSLCQIGRQFHDRGWVFGTSGNFSAVASLTPLRLAITATGVDKGMLTAGEILEVDTAGATVRGSGRPSDEALLHLCVTRARGAGAVLHTHSIWSTMASESYFDQGGVAMEGYEMLKGLAGVRTHQHTEWLPIIDNSQDMPGLVRAVEATLQEHSASHGFLLRRHGLYTWGKDLAEAKRHVEILEFLLELLGRSHSPGHSAAGRTGLA